MIPLGSAELLLTQPVWLLALAAIPFFYIVQRRSRSVLSAARRNALLRTRCLLWTMVVLALSGLSVKTFRQEVFVVFAVDRSLSCLGTSDETIREWISTATQNQESDSWRILPFAGNPIPEKSFTALADFASWDASSQRNSSIRHGATDISAAITTAQAVFPADQVARVVLFSDGRQTRGDALRAADAVDIPIWTVPLDQNVSPEIAVVGLQIPQHASRNETVSLKVSVFADHEDNVLIDVFRGNDRILTGREHLMIGTSKFEYPIQILQDGMVAVQIRSAESSVDLSEKIPEENTDGASGPITASDSEASVVSFRDTVSENNRAEAFVIAGDGPMILLVTDPTDPAESFRKAIEAEGFRVRISPATEMPKTPFGFRAYAAVILYGVPSIDLTVSQMDAIADFVRRDGGGFLMLGSDQSFGPGGYFQTPIEELLPVACDFDQQQRAPALAMMLVIDKSGSMGGEKIELAKDAAKAAVELLAEKDQIGITSFDGAAFEVAPLTPIAGQKTSLLNRISSIAVGGGTNLYPALEQAFSSLQKSSAPLRHVIVLADGYSKPGDFETITERMIDERITVSGVGIGDADPELLKLIARIGQGRYYFADDPTSIPQIFARETVMAGKAAVQENEFRLKVGQESDVFRDIDLTSVPSILGYVRTRPRESAEHIFLTEDGDPLLSWWRFGLGMSAAFTTDSGTRWTPNWLTWKQYNAFWSRVLRQIVRRDDAGNISLSLQPADDQIRVLVRGLTETSEFLNGADVTAEITDPKGTKLLRNIPQSAPGEYELRLREAVPGAWTCKVNVHVDGQLLDSASEAVIVNETEDSLFETTDHDWLEALSARTGGRFRPEPRDVFRPGTEASPGRVYSLRDPLLGLSLIVLLIDIALQRIYVRRSLETN
ncbi:MAG: VWA domain-containing protein [Planctomyces sp.]